jgi:hypothetical protein
MTKQTVAGNAYRWAHPVIEQMVRYRPAAALDFLQADAATKHFVALAVRGWEAHQDRSERVLRQLSGEIFSRLRPIVLAELWDVGFGKLGFLKRLPGRVLTRRQYDELVTALLDPRQRHLLHQCSKISPEELAMITHFDEPILAAASLPAVSKIGAELFDYVIVVVRRHRPDLDDIGLVTILRELGRADGLSAWLRKVLRHTDLPPPPWDGTETIAPLRTVAEIHATGAELRNCLFGDDQSLSAVLGSATITGSAVVMAQPSFPLPMTRCSVPGASTPTGGRPMRTSSPLPNGPSWRRLPWSAFGSSATTPGSALSAGGTTDRFPGRILI